MTALPKIADNSKIANSQNVPLRFLILSFDRGILANILIHSTQREILPARLKFFWRFQQPRLD